MNYRNQRNDHIMKVLDAAGIKVISRDVNIVYECVHGNQISVEWRNYNTVSEECYIFDNIIQCKKTAKKITQELNSPVLKRILENEGALFRGIDGKTKSLTYIVRSKGSDCPVHEAFQMSHVKVEFVDADEDIAKIARNNSQELNDKAPNTTLIIPKNHMRVKEYDDVLGGEIEFFSKAIEIYPAGGFIILIYEYGSLAERIIVEDENVSIPASSIMDGSLDAFGSLE